MSLTLPELAFDIGGQLPFEVGALYSRRAEIHSILDGQQQGGISTPPDHPVVLVFTGDVGRSHGYADRWDDDGVFHYFGEGQSGDMTMTRGNLAVRDHLKNGKRLLVFKSLGHGKPCRFDGEFVCRSSYVRPDTPATRGPNRNAVVFRLEPLNDNAVKPVSRVEKPSPLERELGSTTALRLTEVRTKQELFRRRLIGVEKKCRLTQVMDLRFLRASHIKPWAACDDIGQRVDGHNGLLLTPQADLLFDRGWISFENSGQLLVTDFMPKDVREKLGLKLKYGRQCGDFTPEQQGYLKYHRDHVYEQRFKKSASPLEDLVAALPATG